MAFEFRTYDPRLGRFLSIDPLAATAPYQSGYLFAANNPVLNIDYLGLVEKPKQGGKAKGRGAEKKKGGSFWSGVGRAMSRGFMEGVGRPAPVQTYEMEQAVDLAKDNSFNFDQQLNIGNSTIPDPKLNYHALERNPDYVGLTVSRLRSMIYQRYPRIQNWQLNISAGNALEYAYGEFSGLEDGVKTPTYIKGALPSISHSNRAVIPDFVHSTATEVPGRVWDTYYVYPKGGIVEVKASQNAIKLSTNNHQIEGEIMLAHLAPNDATVIKHRAGNYQAGAYTLVLPYGGTYNSDITKFATKWNVNFYVSYAFIHKKTGQVVFSNPMQSNILSQSRQFATGSNFYPTINSGGTLDIQRAAGFWFGGM